MQGRLQEIWRQDKKQELLKQMSVWVLLPYPMVKGAINPIGGTAKAAVKTTAKSIVKTVAKTTAIEAGKGAVGQVIGNAIEGKNLEANVVCTAFVSGVTGSIKFDTVSNNTKANITIKDLKNTKK